MLLDQKWVRDNFELGNDKNTKEGDIVYVSGFDGFDEVLFPYKVHKVLDEKEVIAQETNKLYLPYVGEVERSNKSINVWYLKKEGIKGSYEVY